MYGTGIVMYVTWYIHVRTSHSDDNDKESDLSRRGNSPATSRDFRVNATSRCLLLGQLELELEQADPHCIAFIGTGT